MKRAKLLCFFICFCSWMYAENLREIVKPVNWEKWDTSPLEGEFEKEVLVIFRNANKYAVNDWYHKIKKFAVQQGEYLELGGTTEHAVRPVAHEAFALAVALKLNVYDPEVTRSCLGRSSKNDSPLNWFFSPSA